MSGVLSILKQLEVPNASNEEIIRYFNKCRYVDDSLISSYFAQRLKKDKISTERISNFLINLGENCSQCISIGDKLNEIIIWLYFREHNREYLYYLLDNDPRSISPLIKDLITCLADLMVCECISFIDDIANNTHYTVVQLSKLILEEFCDVPSLVQPSVLKEFYHIVDSKKVRFKMVLNGMREQTINDLLIETLQEKSALFYYIESQLSYSNVFSYVQSNLKDDEGLCAAICKSSTTWLSFMNHPILQRCLFQKHKSIPKTIKHIYDCAVREDYVYLLIEMGDAYNKKEILKALISSANRSGNRDIVDKFIVLHKKSEDIRGLVPFM